MTSTQVKEALSSNTLSNINYLINKCIQNTPEEEKLALLNEFSILWASKSKKLRKSRIGKTITKNLDSLQEETNQVSPEMNQVSPEMNQVSPEMNQVSPEMNQVSTGMNQEKKVMHFNDINLNNYKSKYVSFIDSKQLMAPVTCSWTDELAVHYLKKSNVLPIRCSAGMVTQFFHLEKKFWKKPITEFLTEFYQRFEPKKSASDYQSYNEITEYY